MGHVTSCESLDSLAWKAQRWFLTSTSGCLPFALLPFPSALCLLSFEICLLLSALCLLSSVLCPVYFAF